MHATYKDVPTFTPTGPLTQRIKIRNYRELTVKVKHADVLAVDKPFLVIFKGPNFMST